MELIHHDAAQVLDLVLGNHPVDGGVPLFVAAHSYVLLEACQWTCGGVLVVAFHRQLRAFAELLQV